MSDHPFVEFRKVSKSFDGRTLVVRDLDFAIRQGEFLTLLGPSGSGKTTTLRMLAGFEDPTSGDLLVNGRSVVGIAPHRRNIGMVFQDYALFPHMSAFDNVAFPLSVRRVDRATIAERVRIALDRVGLSGMDARRPGQLSGGQQQRVALARAMVFEPTLILMDEPLGALDKRMRDHMRSEIKTLHQALGVTTVYVTHDQEEALALSDRIAVFSAGRIVQLDEPRKIYEQPVSAFVADFVGENNRLSATIRSREGDRVSADVGGSTVVLATAMADLKSGDDTVLTIRPEAIITSLEGVPPPDNIVDGMVEDVTYLGNNLRATFSLDGTRQSVVAMVVDPKARTRIVVGDRMKIGWPAEACHALTAEPNSPVRANP